MSKPFRRGLKRKSAEMEACGWSVGRYKIATKDSERHTDRE